jgi:ADP-ribosyl-[dinitrogen reductase] hydrolase
MATGDPYSGTTDPSRAGNGSLMRLSPVPMAFYPDLDATVAYAAASSRTTHGAVEAVDACRLYAAMIHRALGGATKEEMLWAKPPLSAGSGPLATRIAEIAAGGYRQKHVEAISGSGYAVHSLEAALWAFATTESFEAAILAAVNLGDDADTTAAVCGQVAGALYGVEGIPAHWLERLHMGAEIQRLADQLYGLRLGGG